jgi:hypothetical protein
MRERVLIKITFNILNKCRVLLFSVKNKVLLKFYESEFPPFFFFFFFFYKFHVYM